MKGVTTMANPKDKAESINLADITKQVEEMLAKAKAEAEKIVADAKASVSGELTEEQKKAKEERKAYWNELVEVKLFKDNNKYKDDVYVSVNGENIVIKRGERVQVKRKFADVLDKSDRQDYETSILIENKSKEFAKSEL
jgi:hypothetical protein